MRRDNHLRIRTWAKVWAFVTVLLYAKEAWVSGSHSIRFLEPNFFYEYEEGVRKAFISDDQAASYFSRKRMRSTRVFMAALPLFTRFFDEAQQHGIALGTLQLRTLRQRELHGEVAKSATDLVRAEGHTPRLLALNLNAGDKDNYDSNRLIVKLEKDLNSDQASWLFTRVQDLRFAKIAKREAEIAAISEEAAKCWKPGVAATKISKNFALCVGFTDEIRPENEAPFRTQVEALITEIHPAIEKAFRDVSQLKGFFSGDAQRLISVEDKLRKKPTEVELAGLCNPYGPLLDDLGMRTAVYVGGLKVTLLFTIKDRWGGQPSDPQPTMALSQWLEQLGDGPTKNRSAR